MFATMSTHTAITTAGAGDLYRVRLLREGRGMSSIVDFGGERWRMAVHEPAARVENKRLEIPCYSSAELAPPPLDRVPQVA